MYILPRPQTAFCSNNPAFLLSTVSRQQINAFMNNLVRSLIMTINIKNKSCNANTVGKPNSDLQKAFTKTLITQDFKMHTEKCKHTH